MIKKLNLSNLDEWCNTLTGVGVRGKDRGYGATYAGNALSEQESIEMWGTNAVAGRIVELPPKEMLRAGFEITLQDPDEDLTGSVLDVVRTTEFVEQYMRARFYERAFGGGALLIGAVDMQADWALPMTDTIQQVSYFTPLTPSECIPVSWYVDPRAPKCGQPNMYRVQIATPGIDLLNVKGRAQGNTFVVHESRIIRFGGIQTKMGGAQHRWGWGLSVLERCWESIKRYGLTWGSIETLIQDFAPAVIKLAGLARAVAEDKTQAVRDRLELLNFGRSTLRAAVLDAGSDTSVGESYERTQTPVTGLPELVELVRQCLSTDSGIPATKILGLSPGGLNSTGESDVRFYYDEIDAEREWSDKPKIHKVVQMIMRSTKGPLGGKEPKGWDIKFRPLWQPSQKEVNESRELQARTDKMYIETGVLYPEEVTSSRFRKGEFSYETDVDEKVRRTMADAEEEGRAQSSGTTTPNEEGQGASKENA